MAHVKMQKNVTKGENMSEVSTCHICKWVGRNIGATVVLLAVGAIAVYSNTAQPKRDISPSKPVAEVSVTPDPRIEACGPQLDERRARAKALAEKKDYAEAFRLMEYCAPRLAKESAGYREFMAYAIAQTKVVDAEKAAFTKAEKARKKKDGVRIGMSEQEVLDSSWGRPERVSRTTNARGTRGQWVYGGGNYLYFQDGVLTSIQN